MNRLTQHAQEHLALHTFTENAYLNYSMYVIMDRALPFIGDGLKPVQRRIIYAMSELGLNNAAKFKKSARTVGDVLGKYHPHGDSACYEAMVLMAQSFSYRYPLVDGQGNWGGPDDPRSFAAMRYTESRLSKYAEILLKELGEGTVEWQANFDGTLQEPKILPARLPNILLNGTTGIAVGMATDIPPHNIKEIANALIQLLVKPQSSLEELMLWVQGPDFPTEAEIITPRKEIEQLYRTGRGSIKLRAIWGKEDGNAVITALPHQVSGAKILEQIAHQMRAKKLPMLEDLKDESDHEHPTRLVIVPRHHRVDLESVMNHLFATTDLEKSVRINMNMIGLDNRPAVKGLVSILTQWLTFRRDTLRRRLHFNLDIILKRLHILTGLFIAFLNIDKVIHIIRTEDEPKYLLISHFGLSLIQAEAILELKLRHLATLEEIKIRAEQETLEKEKEKCQSLLTSEKKLDAFIKQEIQNDVRLYGQDRRSPLIERSSSKALSEQNILPSESVTVILSKMGWIRCAKGHEIDLAGLNYKASDTFYAMAKGKSHQPFVLLDSTGRSYALDPMSLPSARHQGEPINKKLTLPQGAAIKTVMMGEPEQQYLLASDAGYGFICTFADMVAKNRSGKILMTLPKGAQILPPLLIAHADYHLLTITALGRMLIFPVSDLPILSKGKGNKIISILAADWQAGLDKVVDLFILPPNQTVTLSSGKRRWRLTQENLQKFQAERGRRGVLLPRGFERIAKIDIIAT